MILVFVIVRKTGNCFIICHNLVTISWEKFEPRITNFTNEVMSVCGKFYLLSSILEVWWQLLKYSFFHLVSNFDRYFIAPQDSAHCIGKILFRWMTSAETFYHIRFRSSFEQRYLFQCTIVHCLLRCKSKIME